MPGGAFTPGIIALTVPEAGLQDTVRVEPPKRKSNSTKETEELAKSEEPDSIPAR
jgi:hypothetical protein